MAREWLLSKYVCRRPVAVVGQCATKSTDRGSTASGRGPRFSHRLVIIGGISTRPKPNIRCCPIWPSADRLVTSICPGPCAQGPAMAREGHALVATHPRPRCPFSSSLLTPLSLFIRPVDSSFRSLVCPLALNSSCIPIPSPKAAENNRLGGTRKEACHSAHNRGTPSVLCPPATSRGQM